MKSPNRIYKAIAAIAILIFLAYSLIGIVLVFLHKFEFADFITWFGILGGIISVVGLLSFFQRSTTREDLKELQLDTLREIADSSRKLESVEQARLAAENDITTLEVKKQQMEVMIKKAGLSIFLREQHQLYSGKILEELNSSTELSSNLIKLADINRQLDALDEEISNDENVDLILDIIHASKLRNEEADAGISFDFGSPFLNTLAKVVQSAAEVAVKMVGR